MAITRIGSATIQVSFHQGNDKLEEKRLNELELFALINADIITTPRFPQGKKVDKKVWVSNDNGVSLEIHVK